MRRQRVVQRHARCHREQTTGDQRQQNPGKTYPCRQHGNNFIRTRHSPKCKEERQQQRNRQKDDEHLRDLRRVIANDQKQSNMVVNETRDIVADVEDEPDRDKSGDAVEVNLQEISNDVSIEKSHWIFEFRFAIAELQ